MSSTLERLLIIQDRDRKIAQLTRESKDIPARKAELDARLHEHREAVHTDQEHLKKSAGAIRQIEAEVEELKQKIARFREQQFEIKSNDGYRALEKEIATTQNQISAQEDRELGVLEEMDALRARIAGHEQELKKEEAQVQEEMRALDRRVENMAAEIRTLETDRDALATDVDADCLATYDRIMRHVGDYAVVPVENGSCGGCHMNLTTQLAHDVKKGLDLTRCTYCQRILYWQP